MTEQEQLDKGASALRGLIKAAEKAADKACKEQDYALSAKLRRVVGYLNLAYAEGREIQTAGGIRPKAGGKG